MPRAITRASPSGKRLAPTEANGQASWNAASPLILTIEPAGHMPGVYSFTVALWTKTNPAAGTVTITATWSAPVIGAQSLVISSGLNLVNGVFIAPRHIISSGASAIVVTLTPAGVSGTPAVYVNFPSDLILTLFPENFP